MTITVLPARNEYTASAAQTVFNYTFKIFSNTDLNVYITPLGQEADDSTDLTTAYTVDAGTIENEGGGFITLNSGTSAGDLVTIVSSVPASRTTDYQFNGDFIPDTVNNDFDRVVQLTKQTDDRSGRTLAFEESVQNASGLTLPKPLAINFLRWKADLSGMENVDLTSTGSPTDSSVITYDPPFTGSTITDVEAKLSDIVSIRDFGAIGDGAVNDSPAVQAAVDWALANNKQLFAPSGTFRCDAAIIVTMPNSAGWTGTSTTNNTIGTGAKTFTVESGLPISVSDTVTANAGTLGQGFMQGTVTSYSGTTLQINVTSISGSGSFSGWDVVQNFRNTNAIAAFTLIGSGQDTTEFFFPTTGGFSFVFSSQQHTVHLKDFAITTGVLATQTAMTFTNSYPYFGTFVAQSEFTNVTFRGETGYSQGTTAWGVCVRIANVSNINFDNVLFQGSGVPSGTGVRISSPGAGSFDAPTTTATVFNFVNCNWSFLALGLHYGDNTQSVRITNSFFGQNSTDVFVPASAGTLQDFAINSCTFFRGAPGDGINTLTGVPNLIITNNFFTVFSGFRTIALDENNNTTIVGNQFLPGDTPNGAISAIDILDSDSGSLTIIDSNTFSSTTIGVRLLDGAEGVTIGPGNTHTTNMLLFTESALATDNRVLDNLRSSSSDYTIGYDVGAGGSVTQAPDKVTPVTINTAAGRIITNAASLAAGTEVSFTVNNTTITSSDIAHVQSGNANYDVRVTGVSDNLFIVHLTNNTLGILSDAVDLNFIIIKGVLS